MFSEFVTNILVARKCPNVNLATIIWKYHLYKQHFYWTNIFKASLNITVDTKRKEFQYKYYMHKISNNQFQFKCQLKSHNICDFCSMCLESNTLTF